MSPEQLRGERVGAPSDLYSLGVVLYEMLTGRLPHEADDPIATAMKHLERPPHPREANPAVPAELDALTVRLLAKDPHDRYPGGAAELAEDLRRMRDGLPPLAAEAGEQTRTNPTVVAPARGTPRAGGGSSARRLISLAALLVGVALLGSVAWALSRAPSEQGPSDAGRNPGGAALVEVPDLTGLSPGEARRRLEGANLRLGSRDQAASEVAARGSIIGQDPVAGTRAGRGGAVDVTVGKGPARGNAGAPGSRPASPTTSPSASPSASPASAGGTADATEEAQKAAEEAAKEREKAREEALKRTEERRKAREEARRKTEGARRSAEGGQRVGALERAFVEGQR